MNLREEAGSNPLTKSDIEAGLRKLGLGWGDAVEVHSSLSSFGQVKGGASTVVDALMNVVGDDGALVMSAYLVSAPIPLSEEERKRGITWKVRLLSENTEEQSGMGAIVEEFCRRPEVVYGTGIHRVCAWGRDAQQHSKGYKYLLGIDGWVLLLGVGIDRCSSLHLPEKMVGIPQKIMQYFEVPEAIRQEYPSDVWSIGYGGTPDDAWLKVQKKAEQRGLIKKGRIGRSECMLFKAQKVVSIYEEFLRTDPFGLFGVKP